MNIADLRTYAHSNDIPIISLATEQLLKGFLVKHQPKYCLEIGSAIGYSSYVISSLIQKRGGSLYSFEVSYPSYLQAIQNNRELYNNKIYFLDFLGIDIDNFIYQDIDFVFVDAQKNDYLQYFQKSRHKAKTGIRIFDDVIKYQNKLQSLYEYLFKNQIYYQIYNSEEGDGLMYIDLGRSR